MGNKTTNEDNSLPIKQSRKPLPKSFEADLEALFEEMQSDASRKAVDQLFSAEGPDLKTNVDLND